MNTFNFYSPKVRCFGAFYVNHYDNKKDAHLYPQRHSREAESRSRQGVSIGELIEKMMK